MNDRERFAANALFCRKQASVLKDPDAIAQWERLAYEYEKLAVNPAAQSSLNAEEKEAPQPRVDQREERCGD